MTPEMLWLLKEQWRTYRVNLKYEFSYSIKLPWSRSYAPVDVMLPNIILKVYRKCRCSINACNFIRGRCFI